MLKFDGLYVSRKWIVLQDNYYYVQYFHFQNGCDAKYGCVEILNSEISLNILLDKFTDFKISISKFESNRIQFNLAYYKTLNSKWIGAIEANGLEINFEILEPDFLDIDGLYKFHSFNIDRMVFP